MDYRDGKVCVHTHPGAHVNITISYCSGKDAKNASLSQTHTADSNVNTSSSWTPSTNCRGTADALVYATWNGQDASSDKQFTVQ